MRRLREATLAGEVGVVRKEWGGRFRVALVYPNRYASGMSNLGFLSIHARINARPDALCERAFLPGPAETRVLERRNLPLSTVESGRPLSDFDVVAFSLSYENDLMNVPGMLSAGGVPPLRAARAAGGPHPLVLAGGFAASLNPEPAGTIADAVVVGDGERAVEALLDDRTGPPADAACLRRLAKIPGLYVPGGYDPVYGAGEGGRAGGRLLRLEPRTGFPARVAREAVSPADYPPLPTVLSEESELGAMALVETSRGCPRMCGFCAAAHACPSFREFPREAVAAAVDAAWPHRKKIGFVGAAVLDWRHFRDLARDILARGGSVSPASIRADLVDGEIARILAASGHRTVALAPECGVEEFRGRLGKRVGDEVFLAAGRTLVRAGIVSFKLYFLVGVPGGERDLDVDGTADFVVRFRDAVLREGRTLGKMGTVTAVLSPFVPKPFTPLQWAPMAPENEIALRLSRIAGRLRPVANVRTAAEKPRAAVLQAYLGLSDRRVGDALARSGGLARPRLPADLPLPVDEVVFREKEAGEYFPWDVVDGGLPRSVLRARYESIVRPGGALTRPSR